MQCDLGAIVGTILAATPAHRRALVGIDGVGASGKTTFAAALAERIRTRPVLVLHVDDFFNPSEVRHARGRHSSDGFWLDAYNYRALVEWALVPLSADGDGTYRSSSFDRGTGRTVEPAERQAPPDALVLVEGTFLHRDELVSFWDYSIYLDVPFEEAERRMAERDGLDAGTFHQLMQRYTGAQRTYFAHAHPWKRAALVVDKAERGRPRIRGTSAAGWAGAFGCPHRTPSVPWDPSSAPDRAMSGVSRAAGRRGARRARCR